MATYPVERTKLVQKAELVESAARLGLCATCVHYDGCAYSEKRGESNVIFCEDFSDGQFPVTRTLETRKPRVGRRPSASKKAKQHKGLCRNCVHTEVCAYVRQPGSVWHCEEYAHSR
jgi:hypothetical protein